MKHKLSTTMALVILTMAIAAATARAQTVANGPYYALPSWDQTLPSSTRFIVLSNFASNAVLDRETGLVWEKSPSTIALPYASANARCNGDLVIGSRAGWRLPTLQELRSLIDFDPANTNNPRLPIGHPFLGVQTFWYWSATAVDGFATQGYVVLMAVSNTEPMVPASSKSNPFFV